MLLQFHVARLRVAILSTLLDSFKDYCVPHRVFCIKVVKFKFIGFLRAGVKKQCKDKFGIHFKFT